MMKHLPIALLLLAGCAGDDAPAEPVDEPTDEPTPAPVASVTATAWADELAAVDRDIAAALERAERSEGDWVNLDLAAGGLLRRARLTGSYEDYARAEELLTQGFAMAPEGSGPVSTRAALDYTLHRLDRVGPALEALQGRHASIRPDADVLLRRRGALALQLGRYAEARDLLQQAVDAEPSVPNLSTLALYFWKTGDLPEAERLYREALRSYHGRAAEPVAWLHLQLGIMDLEQDRLDDALAHYRDAAAHLDGWYLVDEHIAEIHTLQGRTDEAVSIYTRVIERTGNPEFMDAMAAIEAGRGGEEASRVWVARARAAYEEQLQRFPEAAYGHALDHYLEFGPVETAVGLASKNHAVRPNGDARVALATALIAAGRPDEARAVVREAMETPYRSPDLAGLAAQLRLAD